MPVSELEPESELELDGAAGVVEVVVGVLDGVVLDGVEVVVEGALPLEDEGLPDELDCPVPDELSELEELP